MKKIIAPILVITAIAIAIYLWLRSRKPKVTYENIDWDKKTVDYTMSINGEKNANTFVLDGEIDKRIDNTKDGKYTFYVQRVYGPQQVKIMIRQDATVLAGITVDFKNKTVIKAADLSE